LQQLSALRLNHPAPEGLQQLLARIHQEYPAVDMLMLTVPDALRERCRPWAIWGLEPAASELLSRQFSFNIQDPRLALRERKRIEVLHFEEAFTQSALLRETMPTLQQLWLLPLIHQGDVRGVLCLGFITPTYPSARQAQWLETLADELALGLRWLEQQEESEYQLLDALKLLVEMAESNREDGQFHSARVSQLAGRLGHKLQMLPAEQRRLKALAYLHDIGKLVLPAQPDDLPHFRQQHVTLGSRMLEAIPAFKPFASAVRYHHERWDGSGYPDGLAGSNIPLYARIIGLASAYEHTLEQQYSPQAAVEYLTKSGYYDPNLCQMLKEIIDHDQVAV
jgi:putative nucleotidyltransferase with HDIG domain